MDGTEATQPAYEGWAIVELMGHRQTAGLVREVTMAGNAMMRIDTPGVNGEIVASQIYGGAAIYCLTPCDEATARAALEEAYSLPPVVRVALRQKQAALPPPDEGEEDPNAGDVDPGEISDEDPFR